jgi:hypothetical protein
VIGLPPAFATLDERENKHREEVRFAHPRGTVNVELPEPVLKDIACCLLPNLVKYGSTHIPDRARLILGMISLKTIHWGVKRGGPWNGVVFGWVLQVVKK